MLRPKQMSKVSVTGSKRVMDDVIEAVHGLNLLHITEYDGSWEEFDRGDPVEGAEDASDKLVTVRAIESILDVGEDDAGPTQVVGDEQLDAELAEVRDRVNELDDRRDDIRSELRELEERIDAVEPFVRLGIDLDLLSGYDSVTVAVGEGDRAAVEAAVETTDDIAASRVFENEGVLAVVAQPADEADEDALTDALVGVEFAAYEVPDAEGDPGSYVEELETRRRKLESRLSTVQNELDELKYDAASFLLAAEEQLSIDVQKTEAPLSFATTENAFVAEGWVPSDRYSELAAAVTEAVGDHAEVEELERASFSANGHAHREETAEAGDASGGTAAATDGGTESARADGGSVVMRNDDPPVVQDNAGPIKPFEVLVEAVSKPKYTEFDPTVVLFLTFPAFFGFMIGDLGYGALYTLIGYYLYTNFDADAFRSMGGITIACGLFTMLFGVLYGEIFGLHLIATYLWEGVVGLSHAPIEKGLSPAGVEWAQSWIVVSLLIGLVHLNVGYVFDFLENLEFHGAKDAVLESGSWIVMMNGLWVFVFSRIGAGENGFKPGFLFEIFNGHPFGLGFAGFPVVVGWIGVAAFFVGLVLLVAGSPVEILEFLNVLVNVLSYARIAAVLLAKAGMAFVVNLLFFGAYETEGEFHFMLSHGPQYVLEHHPEATIMFGGLVHGGVAYFLVGLLVLVLGHALVLALGITSAGLQAVRLEYVEFFGKFYQGGGREYTPFGRERKYTADQRSG